MPALALLDGNSAVTGFEATLVSETGIQAVLRDATSEVAVPVGKYRMYALQVSLKDGHGHWILRFASNTTASADLVEVRKGETTRFDPIGKLKLQATSSLRHGDGETAIADHALPDHFHRTVFDGQLGR